MARVQCEHLLAAPEHRGNPPGAVVDPLAIDDRVALHPEHCRDLLHKRLLRRPLAHQRGRREGHAVRRRPQFDQAGGALLDRDVGTPRGAAALKPRVG